MARRSISLALIALALPAAGWGQAFGRFGYARTLAVPGFKIDQNGFTPAYPISDHIEFGRASGIWKATQTSSTEQTVSLQEFTGNPSKVRASLLAPGFSLYFASGITFKLSATSAPYLTWTEGSASSGVPTPNVSWVILSFRDAQPPPSSSAFPVGRRASRLRASRVRGWLRVRLHSAVGSGWGFPLE